jgi:demethoxyubiquinone hydroxylase (CLK1/Coq7/Cat5 family)
MIPTRLAHGAAASSSGRLARMVFGGYSSWRMFTNICDYSSGSSGTIINLSPSISNGVQQFLAQAPSNPLAARAISDLRSDHAGEWGAVKIYEGVEWAANVRLSYDTDVQALLRLIDFTRRHKESESSHLVLLSHLLPAQHRTSLLPLWSAAGFLLGAVRIRCSIDW